MFHGTMTFLEAREMLMAMGCRSFQPLLVDVFFWVNPAGMIAVNVNCYRPRTNHSFVGFIPISPKNR